MKTKTKLKERQMKFRYKKTKFLTITICNNIVKHKSESYLPYTFILANYVHILQNILYRFITMLYGGKYL